MAKVQASPELVRSARTGAGGTGSARARCWRRKRGWRAAALARQDGGWSATRRRCGCWRCRPTARGRAAAAFAHVTGAPIWRWWWASPAPARARCWVRRGRPGRRRATRCAARRCPASRRKGWRRVGDREPHAAQPAACLGAGAGRADGARRAGGGRGRDDRLAADGAPARRGCRRPGPSWCWWGIRSSCRRSRRGRRSGRSPSGSGRCEITEVRRQRQDWQRQATRELATGRTDAALGRYAAAGMVRGHAGAGRGACGAGGGLGCGAAGATRRQPDHPGVRRDDVRDLNELARACVGRPGSWVEDQVLATERGERAFAEGDRVYFLRNERGLGVKNGTLGTVERITGSGERPGWRCGWTGAGRQRPGGVVRAGGVCRHRPRLRGDGAQEPGGDGGPGACAGDRADGPARRLCRADAAPGRGGAALCAG